jgi:hypothetical protein
MLQPALSQNGLANFFWVGWRIRFPAWLQDIAFFDVEAVGALTSRLGSDCQQVSRIIGNDLNIMFRNALQVVHHVLSLNMGQDDV